MQNSVVKNLEIVLANSYSLALKTQNYHWNVTSSDFKALHEMFEEQYNDLFTAIDEIAERIRALGEKVDGTYENFSKISEIKSGNKDLKSNEMLKDLLDSNETLIKLLKEGVAAAQNASDEVTADVFIGRLKTHEKAAWMIKSSIA